MWGIFLRVVDAFRTGGFRELLRRARRRFDTFCSYCRTQRIAAPLWPLVMLDMALMRVLLGYRPFEYKSYSFHACNPRKRTSFTVLRRYVQFLDRVNPERYLGLARDKAVLLRIVRGEIHRSFIDLRDADVAEFGRFCASRTRFIAKQFDGTFGENIHFHPSPRSPAEVARLYDALRACKAYVLEECISQHPLIGRVYPGAVNTLRILTLNEDGATRVALPSLIRFGLGGREINNPGIEVLIDHASGRMISDGYCVADFRMYAAHPDTGVAFKGRIVPFLDEALALVSRAACKVPQLPVIGWDVAITPDGPEIVEANGGPMCIVARQRLAASVSGGRGLRALYDALESTVRPYGEGASRSINRPLTRPARKP